MTISGDLPKQAFPQLELLPISKGQKYIADLERELSSADGTPLWFVHDGETGTSHILVSDIGRHYHECGSFEGALLFRLMQACVEAGCTFRIWWGAVEPSCYRNVPEFTRTEELYPAIARMLAEGRDISVRWCGCGKRAGRAARSDNSGASERPSSIS